VLCFKTALSGVDLLRNETSNELRYEKDISENHGSVRRVLDAFRIGVGAIGVAKSTRPANERRIRQSQLEHQTPECDGQGW